MMNFNDAVAAMLGNLGNQVQVIPVNRKFEELKQFIIHYVQKHDELSSDHQTIKQIANLNSIDEIEQILRHNQDYCDECLLKMYRKYALGDEDGPICGCGGE